MSEPQLKLVKLNPERSLSREPNKMLKSIAASGLSIDEIRILARIVEALRPAQKMVAINQIERSLFKDRVLTFRYKDLVPENHRNYKGLFEALDSLRTRKANTITDDYDMVDGWISKARHDKKKGLVSIMIGEELIPDYLALGEGYTEYLTGVVFQLNSKHAINLYKLIAKNKDRVYFNPYIPYLKTFLGIKEGQYQYVRDLRNRVLIPAEKELQAKADIYFEADFQKKVGHNEEAIGVLKDGRTITGYRIRIINKSYKASLLKENEEERIKNFSRRICEKVELNNPLFHPTLKTWCNKYGTDNVFEKLNSISGYVKKARPNKKLNYMQRAVYQEFEKKEE